MSKYLVTILIVLGLTACSKKDEQYYRSNPKQLQSVLKACPNQQPDGLTCEQLESLSNRLNRLAYELQLNPQAFGTKILVIQESIAKHQLELKAKGDNAEIKASLDQNEHDLADCLAVVKWLESPES